MPFSYYQADGGVMRSDGAFVPEDPENRDWRAYLAFIAGGGAVGAPMDGSLEEVQAAARGQIEQQAEEQRMAVLPLEGSGLLAWQMRLEEAEAANADGSIDPGEYPLLEAEIPAMGLDVPAVATAVLAEAVTVRADWAAIAAVVSDKKADVDNQVTPAAVRAVLDTVVWPGGPSPA